MTFAVWFAGGDLDVLRILNGEFAHNYMGIYAEVVRGGVLELDGRLVVI